MNWRIVPILILFYFPVFGQAEIYSESDSVEKLNARYADNDTLKSLLMRVDNISGPGGPRSAMITELKSKNGIDSILLLVEFSNAGETYSYYSVALVLNSKGKAFGYSYQYYSGTEKSTLRKQKKDSDLRHFNLKVSNTEYDTLEKPEFPSDLVIVSFRDQTGTWNYRLSRQPTRNINEFLTRVRL
jgi:hypothetical protein